MIIYNWVTSKVGLYTGAFEFKNTPDTLNY